MAMQSSRVFSRAVKHAAASTKQSRSLHMTGPATFSNLLTSERPAINLPSDLAGLRAECQKQNLPTTGSKMELINRLSAHDLTGSRAFSTAYQDSKRPVTEALNISSPIRHFNTSRDLKQIKDSSTIDFTYYPDIDPDTGVEPVLRVPILPYLHSNAAEIDDVDDPVMIPTIYTAAADGTHIHAPSHLSDVTDNNSIDFEGMATTIAQHFSRSSSSGESMARQVWSDLVDDVLGPKKQQS
ncbi:hypothetical protein BU24DRAFT_424707 [Aaosphaeria arxii CBS 175.79]|uniref:SAP domain-containing protein n=1 Tax=Aaosphaeria arxii CBS 175.79 TaxID=1450172 RepID=A0A6A5XLU1_9PLEO|nr:uncharacterized protein BU24DRAFT_424707 [Aaosphaeria arxii CBS 175.79]KAF2013700.1 hypothetical protein BU24DRAFT_424707 [Aaosphaeria arxii CBS 175.79]